MRSNGLIWMSILVLKGCLLVNVAVKALNLLSVGWQKEWSVVVTDHPYHII
jgi:hypothetical protein